MPRRLPAALSPMVALPVLTLWVLTVTPLPVAAQSAASAPSAAAVQHKPNPYGSPLDTIMSTHLWTNVPQAQDFVRETRPAAKDLDYTPLTGKDPDRPKPRDAANVMALQAELEEDGARNAARGRVLQPAAKTRRARKHAASTN